jgi:hypothetical protein
MEEIYVNDSELDKDVFCLVNSKKRHIGAPAESSLESKSGSEAVIAEIPAKAFTAMGARSLFDRYFILPLSKHWKVDPEGPPAFWLLPSPGGIWPQSHPA